MKRAYTNGILLDGTEQMQPAAHKILLTEDDKIIAIVDEGVDLDGYEVIDLHGGYLCPGLINLHVHLAGNGKPSAKPRDNAALVRKILSNGLTRAVAYRLVCVNSMHAASASLVSGWSLGVINAIIFFVLMACVNVSGM